MKNFSLRRPGGMVANTCSYGYLESRAVLDKEMRGPRQRTTVTVPSVSVDDGDY